jgi:pimeloyl-ACP methyl ester carboxylesterase
LSGSNEFRPVLLVRGFDPLGDIAESTYYGFNDGTVYPHKFGEDYIYEGMILKFLKSEFVRRKTDGSLESTYYQDATNVLRYSPFRDNNEDACVTKDEGVAARFEGKANTIWVYRYYDFLNRDVIFYAKQLKRVIEIIEKVTGVQGVNLICHSMGGLVARHLIQKLYKTNEEREKHINKWVTLGTPHRGIAFQTLPMLDLWELEYFNRSRLENLFGKPLNDIAPHFPPERILCVVGTNHRAYNVAIATKLNQFVSWLQGQDQNHSDGLVKQLSATLSGAHRADVFKSHGGKDSLVTSREAFELATRFFFGDFRASIYVEEAEIRKNYGSRNLLTAVGNFLDGKPEFYIGFSVKPRKMDFTLHLQDEASENCFGPIRTYKMTAKDFRWDTEDKSNSRNGLVFQGFFNSALIPKGREDLVFRFDTYAGERDAYLLGHSDTSIVKAQSYFQYMPGTPNRLLFYTHQKAQPMECQPTDKPDQYRLALKFDDLDPDFRMTLRIDIATF